MVSVDRPGKSFTNADTITGTLVYNVREKVDVKSITVELLGIAKTKNFAAANPAKNETQAGSHETRHVLIQRVVPVFPPQNVNNLTYSSKSFTLSNGIHTYPFAIQIPDEKYPIECAAEQKFLHSSGFLKNEPLPREGITLPPSEYFDGDQEFANVVYAVVGRVHKKNRFIDTSMSNGERIIFTPQNKALTFSLRYLSFENAWLPDYDHEDIKLPFSLYKDQAKEQKKSFLKKLMSTSTTEIPLQFRVNFNGTPLAVSGLNSKRLVQNNTTLSNFVNLSLISPLSYESILTLIKFNQSLPREGCLDEKLLAEMKIEAEKIVIRTIRVLLDSMVLVKSDKVQKLTDSKIIYDQNINQVLDISTFEPVINNGADFIDFNEYKKDKKYSSLFPKTQDPYNEKNPSEIYYRFPFPEEWYNCIIPNEKQSFVCCNIKRNYVLRFELTLSTTLNPEKVVTTTCSSPIVMLRNETLNMEQPFIYRVLTVTDNVDEDFNYNSSKLGEQPTISLTFDLNSNTRSDNPPLPQYSEEPVPRYTEDPELAAEAAKRDIKHV